MSSINENSSVKKILTEKYLSGGLGNLTQQEIIQLILAYSGRKDNDVISMREISEAAPFFNGIVSGYSTNINATIKNQ